MDTLAEAIKPCSDPRNNGLEVLTGLEMRSKKLQTILTGSIYIARALPSSPRAEAHCDDRRFSRWTCDGPEVKRPSGPVRAPVS